MAEMSTESRFAHFPTAILSDALDELGMAGVLPSLTAMRSGQGRIAGRALPVRFGRKPQDPDAYRFGGGVGKPLEQVLKTMQTGDVFVMDLGGVNNASAWGGLSARLAQRRGVHGTIIWGTCRDLEEIEEIGYPVWAIGSCPRRSRNDFTFGSINENITIGNVTIGSGDIIIADRTGVVCVTRNNAEKVLEIAETIAKQEALLEDQVMNDNVRSWDEI